LYRNRNIIKPEVAKKLYNKHLNKEINIAKEILISASDFILNDIPVSKDKQGICFSYTPLQRDLCFNSSLLAAEILARAYTFTKNDELKEKVINAVKWVIAHQKDNGEWNYSIDINSGIEYQQTDFHQGYILESIFEIKNLLNIKNEQLEESLKKGIKFYRERQFFQNGSSYWRLPKKYPVEIHNQAQGIITFIKLSEYHTNSNEFASTIAKWTIQNMQAKDGHFYYHNYKIHKHKISYMRWSNAWMFLALTHLIK